MTGLFTLGSCSVLEATELTAILPAETELPLPLKFVFLSRTEDPLGCDTMMVRGPPLSLLTSPATRVTVSGNLNDRPLTAELGRTQGDACVDFPCFQGESPCRTPQKVIYLIPALTPEI